MNWQKQFISLVQEANLAPSVHNVQPAQWKLVDDCIELHLDHTKILPVADPKQKDIRMSLGASIEGMKIAFEKRGYTCDIEIFDLTSPCVAKIAPKVSAPTPRAEYCYAVESRQCFRGAFSSCSEENILKLREALKNDNVTVVTDKDKLTFIAKSYDRANLHFYRDEKFLVELNNWLRFSKQHSRYGNDGLNKEAMALNIVEAKLAKSILSPSNFRKLDKLGLAAALITEAPQIKSSSAVVFFHRQHGDNDFITGQKLYRMWLKATAAGFSFCPISSLTDSKEEISEVTEKLQIPNEIVLAFRAGPSPEKLYRRARRDLKEVVL
jgi:nitroreductase